ncbi:ATP-binding protein [Streptomyces sp. NPDC090493]|uniref:ATP-binding protein n=1 Tax=Streptomyces sp. NPDC090493 TaxID=3365964 RepID=UPI00380228DD
MLEDDRKAKESNGKGILSDSDRKVAINESKDLWTALNSDDVAGQVTKNVKTSGFDKTVSKLIKTVISSESMSEVTGQKFAVPENLHPKAPQRAVPTGEKIKGRGFAKAFGVVGGAVSAAQFPVDAYNYGFEAMAGFRVRYALAARLVNELVEAADDKQLTKTIARYGRVDLLCIDELGYLELDRRGAEMLFQVLTEREEKNSVAIASNESFGGWTKTFTDPRLCAAIVDRLTFNGTIIETGTESYRLAQTKAKQQAKR